MPNFIKEWTDKEVERVTRSFKRHSRFVFGLKFLLPLAIIAMVSVIFLYPMFLGKKEKKIVLVAKPQAQIEQVKPEMANPRFNGMDSKNQPYNISAERAVQEADGVLSMHQINADITLNNGDFVGLVADSGKYNMAEQSVNLFGNVEIFITGHDAKFYEVRTSDVSLDAKNGVASSSAELVAKSPMGNFKAAGFSLNKAEGKISFNGPVKMVIQR